MWETFTFSAPIYVNEFDIVAGEGPVFDKYYPTFRVADFQVIGEMIKTPGYFDVRSFRPCNRVIALNLCLPA